MPYKRLLIATTISLVLVCINTLSLQAQANGDNANTPLPAKTVEIKQSANKAKNKLENDSKTIDLPLVEKQLSENKSSPIYASLDNISFIKEGLHKRILEQKEMQELSRELGINIRESKHLELYRELVYWLGIPYRFGAMSKNTVDCSGFTGLIYKLVYNKSLPRTSRDMAKSYKQIEKEDMEPGDLIFFATRRKNRINHVGIYLGDNKFIHAARSMGVSISSLSDVYYLRTWQKAAKVK